MEFWRALWPGSLLLLAVVIILIAMTVYGDYGWVRKEVDEISGASVGLCTGDTMYYFLVSIHSLHMVPVFLSGFMAWKTKDLDESFSESKWVLALILVQSQVSENEKGWGDTAVFTRKHSINLAICSHFNRSCWLAFH